MRPPFRRGIAGLVLVLLLAPLVLAALVLETAPRVAERAPPDAAAASLTRDVAESLRDFLASEAAAGAWSADEEEINAVLASAQRVVPGVYGSARVEDAAVAVDLSAGAPLLPRGLWANLHLTVAASEDGIEVTAARIGRLPVPAALVVPAARLALDLKLGDGLGTAAAESVAGVRIAPPRVTVVLGFDEVGRVAFFERLRERARGGVGADDRERIWLYRWRVHDDGRRGVLPETGSVLPYLRHVVETAGELSKGADREELTAAIYALTLYCGDARFEAAIGVPLPRKMRGGRNRCAGTTLGGRDDLKRHFVVSAGLYTVTSGSTAFGMGELKELLDSNEGGSGFSFDDMAADAAGVRFAAAFLGAPRSEWPEMLALVRSEADILPSLDGLPRGLGEAEFRARYGDVDSPAYAELVAEIERRLDALPLYRNRPSN